MKVFSKNKKKEKPLNKKILVSFLLVLTISAFVCIQFSKGVDFNHLVTLVRGAERNNMIFAIICFLLYFIITPLSLHLLCWQNQFSTKLYDHLLIGSSEHFFCNVTPFSSGGQPMLIYLFNQKKIPPRQSIGIIIANFIALMIASNLFAVCSLLFFDDFSYQFTSNTIWVVGLGFFLNIMTLFFLIFLAPSTIARKFLKKILLKLCKIKWIGRFLTKYIPAFDQYCENIQMAVKNIFAHKLTFTSCVLLRVSALFCYYAIPYFILRSLGVAMDITYLPYVTLATSFAITAMIWLPTPGGTGGVEFAFVTIFSSFIGVSADISVAETIIWRGLTYYVLLILGFICYLTFEILLKKWRIQVTVQPATPMLEVAEELQIESLEKEHQKKQE